MRRLTIGLAAALLAGCGGADTGQQNAATTERPKTLQPGEYELTTVVEEIKSTDGTTPITRLKMDAPVVTRACVAPDGALDTAMFEEAGDTCSFTDNYVRNGRMSVQLKCTRAGQSGNVMQLVDGDFTADSFEARILGSTGFGGSGDYNMTRKVTANRVGECAAKPAS